MVIPVDWDQPKEDNRALVRRFSAHLFKGEETMVYRLFTPATDQDLKVPLVLYLHGADAVGHDNVNHLAIHDIGTMLVREHWQKSHPCYVLAPQYDHGQHWSVPEVAQGVMGLIRQLIRQHPSIDTRRIYVYGYSAGGVGVFRLIKDHPGFFASALPICGATGLENLEELLVTPIYMVHAADDGVVKCSYQEPGHPSLGGRLSHLGSRDIYHHLEKQAGEGMLTYLELEDGFMKRTYGVNPHCSWVYVSDERHADIMEWMFEKKLS